MYYVICVMTPPDLSRWGLSQSGALSGLCKQLLVKMRQSTLVRLSEIASANNIGEAPHYHRKVRTFHVKSCSRRYKQTDLEPCHPAVARRLLRDGRAAVLSTILLLLS